MWRSAILSHTLWFGGAEIPKGRSAYLTYNAAREGDFHAAYYRKKHQAFSDGSAGSISINDDFGGDIVKPT